MKMEITEDKTAVVLLQEEIFFLTLHRVGPYWVTCSVLPSLQVRPFPTPHLWNPKGLLVTLAAVVTIISVGLFCLPFPPSSAEPSTSGVLSSGADTVCTTGSPLQKNAVTPKKLRCKENSLKEDWFCFNQNQDIGAA